MFQTLLIEHAVIRQDGCIFITKKFLCLSKPLREKEEFAASSRSMEINFSYIHRTVEKIPKTLLYKGYSGKKTSGTEKRRTILTFKMQMRAKGKHIYERVPSQRVSFLLLESCITLLNFPSLSPCKMQISNYTPPCVHAVKAQALDISVLDEYWMDSWWYQD